MADIILGIESSCDDTSAAVISDGYLLSNVLASQEVHKAYGGVIPELASRAHQQNIVPVVSQAMASVGMKDVWVNGFIVGGDLTSASASFMPPFRSSTNLVIAARSSVSDRKNCIAVQLPSGDIRDVLNLAENPDMLGREICLNGDIVESYFGLTGLKSVSDYVLK